MKYRKILLFLVIIASLIISCGNKNNSNTEKNNKNEKNEIVLGSATDVRDLNPHLYIGEMFAQNMLYEGLVSIDKDGNIVPSLAEKWTISEDGKEYIFNLRKGVVFADGEPFNAQAVKSNFDAIMENKVKHAWLTSMELIEKYEIIDENTFKITLKEPYYPLMVELGVIRPFRFISPKAMKNGTTKDGVGTNYVGTGPYVLKQHTIDQEAIFEVNEKYWGEKPKIKTVKIKVIPESQTRIMALEKGEIDIIHGKDVVDIEAINKFKDNKNFVTETSKPLTSRALLVNSTKGALKDKKVRQALQHVINKEDISNGIFEGLEMPAHTLFDKTTPYSNIDLKPYEYSIETTEKLLDEAGWKKGSDGKREKDGKKLEIALDYNSNNVNDKVIAEYFKQQLEKVGIILNITALEVQGFKDKIRSGDFEISFSLTWGTPYDPQSFLGSMKKPVNGDYYAQLGMPEKKKMDDSVMKALKSTNDAERSELFKYALTMLHDEAIYIPITYEINKTVYNSNVENVGFDVSAYEIPFYRMNFKQ